MSSVNQGTRFDLPSGGVPEIHAPLRRLLFRGRGSTRVMCASVSCANTHTVQCSYIDRHGVACETRWCRQHIQLDGQVAYCPAHIVSVQPPMRPSEHKVGAVVDWMARAIDDDVVAMMRPAVAVLDEIVLSEPVRFAAIGINRVRTWERMWKSYSDAGVGCRVSIAIEDQDRDTTHVRFNGTTVVTMMTPWGPAQAFAPEEVSDRLVAAVLHPLTVALDVWTHNTQIQLRGASLRRAAR